eukprot:4747188-Pleurochrysis_carterae.AAC.3
MTVRQAYMNRQKMTQLATAKYSAPEHAGSNYALYRVRRGLSTACSTCSSSVPSRKRCASAGQHQGLAGLPASKRGEKSLNSALPQTAHVA